MMAHRYWTIGHSMGYVGTKTEEDVDACDYLAIDVDSIKGMDDIDIEDQLAEIAYEEACEKISAWAKPKED